MAERRPSYRDGDRAAAGEPGRSWRPPRAQSHGGGSVSVPLWERKFCTDACSIPWAKLCETKKLMSMYSNIVDWDDSAGFEAFRDAKERFYAVYHGQHCDIPLPDPNMYIDVVNPDEYIDPELVADLERSRRSLPRRDTTAPDGWDSFIFTNKPVPATGWGDGETINILGQQCSVNWDNYVEQPIEANCKQGSGNWDNYANQPAETFVQQSSGNWDMYVEQQGPTSSWGAPIMPGTSNWDMNVDTQHAWNNHDYGWGSAAVETDSWGNQKDSYCAPDSQQAQGGSYGHWRRRNNESGRRNSRNRDRGGPISSKAMKSKYQADEHSGANNSWRHCRARDSMHYSYEQPGYSNQSLAM